MKPRILVTRLWADEDMVELQAEICDGTSLFRNRIHVGHQRLKDALGPPD